MTRLRPTVRASLTASAVAAAAVALTVLIAVFNLVLDARLRSDGDGVLRERAAAVLRGLGSVDGRLSVIEAADEGAADTQTWIFSGQRALEQPAQSDKRNRAAATALARGSGLRSVSSTDTRLLAVPVVHNGRRLGAVVVGASVEPYESTASSALIGSAILGAAMLLAVAALARWLTGRALRPVVRMTAQAAEWSEHDLNRRFFTGEARDELSGLAAVFDRLLSRLSQSLSREQRLTAEISHELRTPLTKISAEAEIAGARERATDEYRSALQAIAGHARDLARVLESLLSAARSSAPGAAARSDALVAARRAISLLDGSGPGDARIELLRAEPVRVAAEAEVIERILSPLLENALRYARERVTVSVAASGGEALLVVADDGPGLSEQERRHAFDPGYRANGAPGETHRGAGLGLPLAKRLARSAGGEIELAEPPDGGGAAFAVRLPLA
ncbi:MAG TPA: HAMP domain-containing sensor histidine kinase [Solirubrobacteraceae bacterium]